MWVAMLSRRANSSRLLLGVLLYLVVHSLMCSLAGVTITSARAVLATSLPHIRE